MEHQQGLTDRPPLKQTSLTPIEIIGAKNMQLFVQFLNVSRSYTNTGGFPERRLEKEIGVNNLRRIAVVMKELRANGYYPYSVDGKGKIHWKVIVKSKFQEMFDEGLDDLQDKSISELRNIARAGYRKIAKGSKR